MSSENRSMTPNTLDSDVPPLNTKCGAKTGSAKSSRNSVAAQVAADLNMPRAVNNRFIDTEASRVSIDARLLELERIAQQTGTAVGIGTRPYPVTIERVAAWAATLDAKGFDLVPVSAIANRQAVR